VKYLRGFAPEPSLLPVSRARKITRKVEDPTVEAVSLDRLHPAPWNPRTIKDERSQNLVRSIQADPGFLWRRPILATAEDDGRGIEFPDLFGAEAEPLPDAGDEVAADRVGSGDQSSCGGESLVLAKVYPHTILGEEGPIDQADVGAVASRAGDSDDFGSKFGGSARASGQRIGHFERQDADATKRQELAGASGLARGRHGREPIRTGSGGWSNAGPQGSSSSQLLMLSRSRGRR